MKSGNQRKAPKIPSPSKKHPNYMREFDNSVKRKSPQQPMKSKRLSK